MHEQPALSVECIHMLSIILVIYCSSPLIFFQLVYTTPFQTRAMYLLGVAENHFAKVPTAFVSLPLATGTRTLIIGEPKVSILFCYNHTE